MSKLQNLEFVALKVSGENYLKWALDMKIHLMSKDLGDTIAKNENVPTRDKYKAIGIIRHHLEEPLKDQYLTIEEPLTLWLALKKRYDHQRTIFLPQAQHDWMNLRFQDFESVDDYNSALFKIVAVLKLCGQEVSENELLEKTLSTFHPSNMVLQQQYRERRFTEYSALNDCLLLAEKNNELLVMNSSMRPPGTAPLPAVNRAVKKNEPSEPKEANAVQGSGGRGRSSRRHGRGKGRGGYQARGDPSGRGRGRGRGRGIQKPARSVCHRCGMDNHWSRTCRTAKHLRDLYQASKKKNPEAHAVHHDVEGDFDQDNDDAMDYESSDLLADEKEE